MDQTNRQRILSAIANPLSITVGAIGGTTFGLSGVWWILPLTAVAFGAVVTAQLRTKERTSIEALPLAYAQREKALSELMVRVVSSLESSSPTIRTCLSTIPSQIDEVKRKIRDLLRRQARIDAFLAAPTARLGQDDLKQLEQALASARTEAARQRFSSALENKRRDIEAREDLRASSERIVAELADLESALENTLSRIISLGDAQDSPSEGEGIANDLGEVLITIQSLEQALSEVQDPSYKRLRA